MLKTIFPSSPEPSLESLKASQVESNKSAQMTASKAPGTRFDEHLLEPKATLKEPQRAPNNTPTLSPNLKRGGKTLAGKSDLRASPKNPVNAVLNREPQIRSAQLPQRGSENFAALQPPHSQAQVSKSERPKEVTSTNQENPRPKKAAAAPLGKPSGKSQAEGTSVAPSKIADDSSHRALPIMDRGALLTAPEANLRAFSNAATAIDPETGTEITVEAGATELEGAMVMLPLMPLGFLMPEGFHTIQSPAQSQHKILAATFIPSDPYSSMNETALYPVALKTIEAPGEEFIALSPQDADIKDIEALLLLMGVQPQSFLQQMPSLALLTGQLENINPSAVPQTIAGNPLMQTMLASADPSEVLDQVKPLGEWLEDLGLTPPTGDPSFEQPMSLRQLMKELDVDPDRVIKEALIMQATLPLEGMSPYIQRAERLYKEPMPAQAAEQLLSGKTPGPRSVDPGTAGIAQAIAEAGVTVDPKSLEAAVNQLIANPHAADLLQIDPKDLKVIESMLQGLSNEIITSESTPASKEALVNPWRMERDPSLDLTTQFAPLAPQDFNPLMPQNIQRNAQPLSRQQLMEALQKTAKPLNAEAIFIPDTALNVMPAPSNDWLQNLQAFHLRPQDSEIQLDAQPRDAADASLPLLQNLEIDPTSSDTSPRQDRSHDDSDFAQSEAMPSPITQHKAADGSKESFHLQAPEKPAAIPPQVVKEIFDKASMMVKEGGGSMRLELGNNDLGSINLAIEVKDNNVEIKISASSQHTREQLATELPKLREALQGQNLNLDKVEIGLGGGSSFSQSSSDGRSFRQDQYESQEETSLRGINGKGRASRSYKVITQEASASPLSRNHDGSIQVRI